MSAHRNERQAWQCLQDYLHKFGPVGTDHETWIPQHATYSYYPKQKSVYQDGYTDKTIFYVCSGMLGRIVYEEDEKRDCARRRILSIGLPNMAMTTTEHLYTANQQLGDIIALRPSHILQISYRSIIELQEQDAAIQSMIAAMGNKKRRLLTRLRYLSCIRNLNSRYLEFARILPELRDSLSQIEQQDLLGISRSTVQRNSYFLIKGIHRR